MNKEAVQHERGPRNSSLRRQNLLLEHPRLALSVSAPEDFLFQAFLYQLGLLIFYVTLCCSHIESLLFVADSLRILALLCFHSPKKYSQIKRDPQPSQ